MIDEPRTAPEAPVESPPAGGKVSFRRLRVFGLMALAALGTAIGVGAGSAGPLASGVPNLLLGAGALALFGWMLVARIRHGVWACRSG